MYLPLPFANNELSKTIYVTAPSVAKYVAVPHRTMRLDYLALCHWKFFDFKKGIIGWYRFEQQF